MTIPGAKLANEETVARVSRRRFLQYLVLQSPLYAWWLSRLSQSTALSAPMRLAGEITFSGQELLGRPTDTSICINVVPDENISLYYEYGTSPGVYTEQTSVTSATGGQPHEVVIGGLDPHVRYYYRMQYQKPGDVWVPRAEHSFWTQRATGSPFTFTVTSDSHVNIMLGNAATWTQTMTNVAADHPDLHLDLGDTFAMDSVNSVAGAESAYLYQRQFFDLVGHSASIFLAAGNHEQEEAWHLDDTGNPATSQPVMGTNARKKYYPNPVPDGSYSGNLDTYSYLDGDQLMEDYYAWTWGDALFVVIDPYWYTTTKPYVGNMGGGEGSDTGSGDRWDWTLGQDQFNWLKQVLESSDAQYKFIFAHHMVGGSDDYVRGGANPAHICEWGGYNEAGTTYEWTTRRPGWGSDPVHEILVDNSVSAFFHGHDHQYAYEVRDGVVYQSLPAAGFSGNGFNIYSTGSGYTIQALPSPGHLRVTVSPSQATVDYVQTSGGGVAYSYTILGGTGEPPIVSGIPNQTITEGGSFETIHLDNYVSDPDNSDAEMTWTYSGNSALTVSIVDRVATIGIPSADWNGSEDITFRATDPGGLWDDDSATFTVTAVNDPPVVADIPNQTIALGESFASIHLDDYVSDPDNSDAEMTWSYSGNSALTVSIVNRVATIGIPSADWSDSETITFRATDPGGLWGEDSATFAVATGIIPPDTNITAHPDDPSLSTDASFSFTSVPGGLTFECQLDGGGFAACSSPKVYTDLDYGAHTFEVRAINEGNPDPTPASYSWTIYRPVFVPLVLKS